MGGRESGGGEGWRGGSGPGWAKDGAGGEGVLERSSANAVTRGVQRCLCNLRNHGETVPLRTDKRAGSGILDPLNSCDLQ